jgi:SPP1 gp7 family putative phage head morphogenesis protein
MTLEVLLGMGVEESVMQFLDRSIAHTASPFRAAASSVFSRLVLSLQASAGNAIRCDVQGECLDVFDVTNPEAVAAAEAHAAELVTSVTVETRAALNQVVQRMFTENIAPKQAAGIIKKIVGLTEIQANAVVNLHQKILTNPGALIYAGKTPVRVPKTGMDAAQLDRTLTRYADKLTRQRAMNIARTETVKAANEGQTQLWKQAQQRGDLPNVIRHEWIASYSERTCPVCSALNGEVVVVGEAFSNGSTQPPAHPMCRCSTGMVL